MKKKVFISKVLGMSSVMLILNISAFVYNVYVSSQTGADGIGLFHLVMSVFSFCSCVAVSGIGLTSTRLISDMPPGLWSKCADSVVVKCIRLCLVPSGVVCAILLLFAEFVSGKILGVPQTSVCFRVLAPCLVCMSVSSVINGYFTAYGAVGCLAFGKFMSELSVWSVTLLLLKVISPDKTYMVVVYAFCAGNICEFICNICLWRRLRTGLYCKNGTDYKSILSLCVPIALGSYLRTGLGSLENILVPNMLKIHGSADPVGVYGLLKGMTLPVLMFPTVFTYAFTNFIVPEIAKRRALGYKNGIVYVSSLSLEYILRFAVFVSAVFWKWHSEIGLAIYGRAEVSRFLGMLCLFPLFWFLDSVTDAVLKGLNQQVASLKINICDALSRVLGVALFIPVFGIEAYIVIICASEVVNFLFSFLKLRKVCKLRFPLKKGLITSLFAVLICELTYGFYEGCNLWASVFLYSAFYLLSQSIVSSLINKISPDKN